MIAVRVSQLRNACREFFLRFQTLKRLEFGECLIFLISIKHLFQAYLGRLTHLRSVIFMLYSPEEHYMVLPGMLYSPEEHPCLLWLFGGYLIFLIVIRYLDPK